MIYLLIEALKEQQAMIEALSGEKDEMRTELEDQKARLDQIEALLSK
jgi:hypothetical protein